MAEVSGLLDRYGDGPAWTVQPSELPDLLKDLLVDRLDVRAT